MTGLQLVRTVEPGEIGHKGRYKGQPTPYGAAYLGVPDDIPGAEKLTWLLDAALAHIETLRQFGATRIEVWAAYGWRDQCGLAYTPAELAKLGRLGVPFCVDFYEEAEAPEPREAD